MSGTVSVVSDIRTGTVTIANAASLSDACQCPGQRLLCGVRVPSGWTTAAVSFQVSHDGGTTYSVLWSDSGAEYSIAAVTASLYVAVDPTLFLGATHVKIQSGTSGATVNQSGSDIVTLVFR
jgi:hypothetical protein